MTPELAGLWTHWHAHPDVLLGLAALQGAYILGIGPLREKYNLANADDVSLKMFGMFTAGILVILISLVSPLHVLADNYLFSAHMTQHIALTLIAPPLLIAGTPGWLISPLLRNKVVFKIARVGTHPVVGFGIFNLVFSLWHFPALYSSSIDIQGLHIFEHLMFLGTGVMLWWPLTSRVPELPRAPYLLQLTYFFALSIAQIIVFAAITFADRPLYEVYATAPRILDLTPLEDQQVGGLIMKVGGGILFVTLFVTVFFRWYAHDEADRKARLAQRDEQDERLRHLTTQTISED